MPTSNKNPKDRGWIELLQPRKVNRSAATLKQTYPWAVVGAGFAGLSCASRLAQLFPDKEILLIDAGRVGEGASGRNSGYGVANTHFPGGFVPSQVDTYLRTDRLSQTGLDLLRKKIGIHAIECGWSEAGFHYCAAEPSSMHECELFQDYLEKMEIPHSFLDQHQLQSQLGTNCYQSGIHIQGGVLLQPAALVCALADNLPENVTLIEDHRVDKIERTSPVQLCITDKKVEVEKLILTTNFQIANLGSLRSRVLGLTLSTSLTRKMTDEEIGSLGSREQWGVLSLHSGGATVRLTGDRRICIRNTAEVNGEQLHTDKQLGERINIHRAAFDRRFPHLQNVPFEYSWSCVEGVTANRTNCFEKLHNNIFFAGIFNGSGISKGTAFGHAMAEYAAGSQSNLITDCLQNPKPTWLPPNPFRSVGAQLRIRTRFRGVGFDR